MELDELIKLIERQILAQTRHANYARVVRLAQLYKLLITGEEIEKLLIQFVQRETAEAFAQRILLTQLITPALASGILKPFYKVSRNDKVTKRIDVKDAQQKEVIQKMLKLFYGNTPDADGMDEYLQTRFVELTFADPNAWVVVEFDGFDYKNTFAQPRPFEVSAEEAVNFEVHNGVTKWLLVKQTIAVKRLKKTTRRVELAEVMGTSKEAEYVETITGFRYTLYSDTFHVVYEQVDEKYLRAIESPLLTVGELVVLDDKKKDTMTFIRQTFDPKLSVFPAERVGYLRDLYTDGDTFVNPFHSAMCYFLKSVKTVSELDLSMTLHVFPQKLQYVQRCRGFKETPCDMGKQKDGNDCKLCKGKGYVIHTSAQDAIILPMPEDKEDMLDLNQIIQYASPPESIIKLQMEYTETFEPKIHKAVFNSTVFIANTVAQTATEKELDMDSIYDTLSPFAKAASRFYKFIGRVAIDLADVNEPDAAIVHAYPADFKLKTIPILIAKPPINE